jgi:hypothetical protein
MRLDRCSVCHGVSLPLVVLRRFGPEYRVKAIWTKLGEGPPGGPCASCDRPMVAAPTVAGTCWLVVDTCRKCELLWFDAKELASFTPIGRALHPPPPTLSPRAVEALAGVSAEELAAQPPEDSRALSDMIEAMGPVS